MTQRSSCRQFATEQLATATPWWWLMLSQQLSRTAHQLRQEIGLVAAAHGLSTSEALLLLACAQEPQGHSSQKQLAAEFGCSAAQISGQLDALRGRGLLRPERLAKDRRRQSWQATTHGRDVAAKLGRRLARKFALRVDAACAQHLAVRLAALRQQIGCGGHDQHDPQSTDEEAAA